MALRKEDQKRKKKDACKAQPLTVSDLLNERYFSIARLSQNCSVVQLLHVTESLRQLASSALRRLSKHGLDSYHCQNERYGTQFCWQKAERGQDSSKPHGHPRSWRTPNHAPNPCLSCPTRAAEMPNACWRMPVLTEEEEAATTEDPPSTLTPASDTSSIS
jgi:hypothetical protein